MRSPDRANKPKTRSELDEEFHARNCAVRNTRTALLFVAFFTREVLVSWRTLDKPYHRPSLIELPFFIVTVAIGVRWLLMFRCAVERLVLGLSLINFATGVVSAHVPSIGAGPFSELIGTGKLSLWVFVLVVTIGMLILSARSHDSV
jgi:hypothetical protein